MKHTKELEAKISVQARMQATDEELCAIFRMSRAELARYYKLIESARAAGAVAARAKGRKIKRAGGDDPLARPLGRVIIQ